MTDRKAGARRCAGALVAIALCALLGGCATPPQTRALLSQPQANLPRQALIPDLPYYVQDEHQCGPATLAMALEASGVPITPADLTPQVYLPGRAGSLQVELLAATRRHHRMAYTLAPQLSAVLKEIAAGHPVVVLQNLAFNWYPIWHYALAIGYDLDRRVIILRSGPEPHQNLPLKTFEYTWARGGHWAFLVLPAGGMPATAQPAPYLQAALALETTGQQPAARRAYAAATQRWPDLYGAWIGLGNTSYAVRDFSAAATAFRRATRLRPDDPDAFNNLADTLMQLGDLDAAQGYAQTAVRLGGDRQRTYRQTLQEIEARRTPAH